MFEIKTSEYLKEGDVVFLNPNGQAQKFDHSSGTAHSLGIMQNNRAVFSANNQWLNTNWNEPEPLTPTQELCDLACTLNGIEPPNRKPQAPEMNLAMLQKAFDDLNRARQKPYQPQQVIMHPDQYAAFKKALAQK